MARIPFTAEEKDVIRTCAKRVWQMIGADIFAACAELGEPRDTITRAEIVELVLDCDRTAQEVAKTHPELSRRMLRADYHHLNRIVGDAFPAEDGL